MCHVCLSDFPPVPRVEPLNRHLTYSPTLAKSCVISSQVLKLPKTLGIHKEIMLRNQVRSFYNLFTYIWLFAYRKWFLLTAIECSLRYFGLPLREPEGGGIYVHERKLPNECSSEDDEPALVVICRASIVVVESNMLSTLFGGRLLGGKLQCMFHKGLKGLHRVLWSRSSWIGRVVHSVRTALASLLAQMCVKLDINSNIS